MSVYRPVVSRLGLSFALLLSSVVACSPSSDSPTAAPQAKGPFVAGVQNVVDTERAGSAPLTDAKSVKGAPASAGGSQAPAAIQSRVTLLRAALEGQTFLFGSDLQTYAVRTGDTVQSESALSIGHIPAKFRILEDRVQLVQDQSYLFESDVARPDSLIHEFPIVSQTATSITIEIKEASPQLATMGGGTTVAAATWVRSAEYIESRDMLLFETSVEMADGGVYEFMESIFPRSALVTPGYTPFGATADDEPLSGRYGYLSAGKVWITDGDQRRETSFASRFDLRGGKALDWYITSNVPDVFLPSVKAGVEGWNRYSKAMGIADLVAFRGRLPANIKVGDPRYNVIVWDDVANAGAAYESQATDPLTGISSHSMIYLPKAWFNIGYSEWDAASVGAAVVGTARVGAEPANASDETPAASGTRTFLGREVKAACVRKRDASLKTPPTEDAATFGLELVRGTLFHEVGHSFGLSHNFKGSLTFDGVHADSFSSSIMDYNIYELDRAAFASSTSTAGPLLEYDRQAMSALYNGAKDIKSTDPVVAHCKDAEVPKETATGVISPYCIQYDGGANPIAFAQANVNLLFEEAASVAGVSSLATALKASAARLPNAATILTVADATTALKAHAVLLRNVLDYYTWTRAGSLISPAPFYLSPFDPATLPKDANEPALHAQAFDSLTKVATLPALPKPSQLALDQAVTDAAGWLATTPAFASLAAAEVATTEATLLAPVHAVSTWFNTRYLPAIRETLLGTLVHSSTLPYAFSIGAGGVDYEAKAIDLLETSILGKINGQARPAAERLACATALATYITIDPGVAAITRVQTALQAEIAAASNGKARSDLRNILATVLGIAPAAPAAK